MSNQRIVLASITLIVATGILALNPSIMIENAQAELYANEYGYDSNYYYQGDNIYSYDKKDSKSYGDIQKISCVNSNINVNGVDITQIPEDNTALGAANEGVGATDASNSQNGNGLDKINFERNLVNICVNVNANEQVKVTPPPEEEPSPCENCFSVLSREQINALLNDVEATSIGAYCDRLASTPNSCQETDNVFFALEDVPGVTRQQAIDIIQNCLADTGVIDPICIV